MLLKADILHIGSAVGLNSLVIYLPYNLLNKYNLRIKGRYLAKIGEITWPCAIMPINKGDGYIIVNKTNAKKLAIRDGDTLNFELDEDSSEYGMPMPEELQVLLDQDEYGKQRFDELTKGKQRNIIYFVSQSKSSQVRIDRAIQLIEKLKLLPAGKVDIGALFRK